MEKSQIITRIDFVIQKGQEGLSHLVSSDRGPYVPRIYYAGFRSAGLALIVSIYGEDHPYFKEFNKIVENLQAYCVEGGIGILNSIKEEIEGGWLTSYRQLVSAEIFSDFLEMAEYLLEQSYKDAAAVMIGSVLEEHLRQLCQLHYIDTHLPGEDRKPKKADSLNSELAKNGVYGKLDQKNVTAWLDLRNKSAHGNYQLYSIDQVRLMYQGVLDFIARIIA